MGVLEERMVKSSKFWLDLSFKVVNVVTPLQINDWNRKNPPIEKENHLNQTSILIFKVI